MRERSPTYRWLLVAFAAAAMGGAGTYQFVWSSLSGAVGARTSASEPALGTVFTLFVVAQTLVQLPAGTIRDRYGPRNLLVLASVFLFAGYAGVAVAPALPFVYLSYAVGGLGAGIAYTVAVNTPVKWFDDRRGLATGLVTMSYGGVSVLAIPLVRGRITAAFDWTLLTLGASVGVVCLAAAATIRDPEGEAHAEPRLEADGSTTRDSAIGWRTAAATWQFWTFYAVMVAVNGVGLMLISQSVAFATGLGLSPAVATSAASTIALADGAGLLVLGGLSDRLGGERTAGVSLVLCGGTLAAATVAGKSGFPLAFVVLLAATAFFRSPVFSIFPTLVGRYYGPERSSENYAAIYTAKVPGGVLGGTVTAAVVGTLGWTTSFYLGAGFVALAGIATLSLRPVRRPSG